MSKNSRCKACGMPMDRYDPEGDCPYCAEIYPHSEPHPDNAVRCNGCGNLRAESHTLTIPDEDEEEIIGTYCRGCLKILDEDDIEPGQHEQYTLMETKA